MYTIGVDGGGTKTKFVLLDEKTQMIESVELGTCHFMQVGFEGLEKIIAEGLEILLGKAQLGDKDIGRVGLDIAGYGRVKEIATNIEKAMAKACKAYEYYLFNDVEIAHAGALNNQDGIVVIAGTGSIAFGKSNGKTQRTGGWGFQMGDEGSAYWIGKKSLELYGKQADGRLPKSALYYQFMDKYQLTNAYDMIRVVGQDLKGERGAIAQLAKLCHQAALDKDEAALKIFDEAGYELAQMINALVPLFEKEVVKASYIGGVFKSGPIITEAVQRHLLPQIQWQAPLFEAEIGAALLAKEREE